MEENTIEKIIQNYKDKNFMILKEYIENSHRKVSFIESNILIFFFINKIKEENNSVEYENWVRLLKEHILTKKIIKYLHFDLLMSLENHSQIKSFLDANFNINKKDYLIYKFLIKYKENYNKKIVFFQEKNFFNFLNQMNELIDKYKINLVNFDELLQYNQNKINKFIEETGVKNFDKIHQNNKSELHFLFFLAIKNGYKPKNEDIIQNFKEYLIFINNTKANFAIDFLLEQFVKTKFYINTIQPSKNLEKKLDEIFNFKNIVSEDMRELVIKHPILKLEKLKESLEKKQKKELFNTEFLTKKMKKFLKKFKKRKI